MKFLHGGRRATRKERLDRGVPDGASEAGRNLRLLGFKSFTATPFKTPHKSTPLAEAMDAIIINKKNRKSKKKKKKGVRLITQSVLQKLRGRPKLIF